MKFIKLFRYLIDPLSAILALLVAAPSYAQARIGAKRLPITFKVWDLFRVSPIRHHYYQPIYNVNLLPLDRWEKPDALAGVAWNASGQLALLRKFNYQEELLEVPMEKPLEGLGFFHNHLYGPADAEILYNMIRYFKPKRVIEIGSGYSTRMMKLALDINKREGVDSTHVCIEPYEMPWLESLGVDEVMREKVEDVPLSYFDRLKENDVLFIDSSHVIRTGGDVVTEYLRILPRLNQGVLIHMHDIFLPYEYPIEWIAKHRRFWTEQYLLQAFLAFNTNFEIISAVNWLAREHSADLSQACPVFAKEERGHGAFWIRRIAKKE